MPAPRFAKDYVREDSNLFDKEHRFQRKLQGSPRGRNTDVALWLRTKNNAYEYKVIKEQDVFVENPGIQILHTKVYFPADYIIYNELLISPANQIVRMTDFWLDDNEYRHHLTEYEYCEGGDGNELIKRVADARQRLPLSFIQHMIIHLSLATIYLETGSTYDFQKDKFSSDAKGWIPITHRDICPKHVFFRFQNATGDNFAWPEPVLGNLRYAIPAESYYNVVAQDLQGVDKIVNKKLEPYYIEGFTFNRALELIPSTNLPPDSKEVQQKPQNTLDRVATHKTPPCHWSTNAYQVGATIIEIATGRKWDASLETNRLSHDKTYLEEKLKQLSMSKSQRHLLIALTDPNPKNRLSAQKLKGLISTVVKARNSQAIEDRLVRPQEFAFPKMPKEKRPAPDPQDVASKRERRPGTAASSRRGSRPGSATSSHRGRGRFAESADKVKQFFKHHSPSQSRDRGAPFTQIGPRSFV
jgi:serine/threonine protein kinase